MKVYKAVIIDDEPKLQEVLAIKLKNFCPQIQLIGIANNVSEGFELLNKVNPQIVFLDISMPDGNGFDLVKKFEKIDFEIIFVTGYDQFAVDAFRISAVDYLLKPIDTQQLIDAVSKAEDKIASVEKLIRYKNLENNLELEEGEFGKIAIPGKDDFEYVKVNQIVRCQGLEGYTKLYFDNNKSLLSSYSIGFFRSMLEPFDFFYNIHKSHLINVGKVFKYSKDGNVHMSDKCVVPVSRRKRDEFLNYYQNYLDSSQKK